MRGDGTSEITHLNIQKDIFDNILEYCKYASEHLPPKISKPVDHENMLDVTSPWYADYVNKYDDEVICGMLLAAN